MTYKYEEVENSDWSHTEVRRIYVKAQTESLCEIWTLYHV